MEGRKERDTNLVTDLTLGLVDSLTNYPGVRDVSVNLRQGCERASVSAWEQRHGVTLPVALKQLYTATDGFSLTWNFTISGRAVPLGNLEVQPLSRLSRVTSGRGSGDPLAPSMADLVLAEEFTSIPPPIPSYAASTVVNNEDGGNVSAAPPPPEVTCKKKPKNPPTPSFHISKLFEIDTCQGYGRVLLAFPGRGESYPEASFWFCDLSLRLHHISSDFASYWRLILFHLGMPQWQGLVAGLGLTPWARQWYEILAPHILDGSGRYIRTSQADLQNKLDWSVFRPKKQTKGKGKDTQKEAKGANKDSP